MAHNFASSFSSVTFHGSITFVPRITLAWPAIIDAVRYLRTVATWPTRPTRTLKPK